MKTYKETGLTFEDVERVASSIGQRLTEAEKTQVLEMYPSEQEQDPTGSWVEVIEQCIYNVIDD